MDTASSTLARYKMFIGGEWVDAASGETFPSDNPFTGKPWALIPRGGAQDADRAVRAAHKAFAGGEWPKLNASRRGALLRRLGDLIGEKSKFLAEIEVRDNGKLYAEMSAQTAYMAQWYYYYGGLADKIEGHVIPTDKPDMLNYTRYEPLGVVAAITPWNFPAAMITRKSGPALAAGCTFVCKPATQTPYSALAMAELAERAGVPKGVFNVVTGSATEIGVRPIEPCCSSRASDCVSFSSDFSPKPFRSRSLCSASTRRRSSIEATPSSARSRLTAFGPKPWMLSSATTAGGCFARSPSSLATFPVSSSSRIFSAVLLPTPSICCRSFTVSAPRSDPCALIDCAALS